jgi:hypothetical protein
LTGQVQKKQAQISELQTMHKSMLASIEHKEKQLMGLSILLQKDKVQVRYLGSSWPLKRRLDLGSRVRSLHV